MSRRYARAEDSMQSVCELEKIKMTQRTHRALPFMQVQQSGSCECESEIKIRDKTIFLSRKTLNQKPACQVFLLSYKSSKTAL